ncbi:hypothetical protein CR513_32646, partial [Mucuna pruriens]
MCDASNSALGAVLGQRAREPESTSKCIIMDPTQLNYTTTEKELLAIAPKLSSSLTMLHLILLEEAGCKAKIDLLNKITPWFGNICNFIIASQFPPEASRLYKEKLKSDAKYYIWDDPYLWRLYNNQVIRRCISDSEIKLVLQFCHAPFGGSLYGSTRIA